jgi:hypothetical protein
MLAGPAAALAREAGAAAVFTRRVGGLSGASPALPAGRPFVLAGVQWTGPPGARIEMRARDAGGSWSPWAQASVRGHGPDRPAAPGVLLGEPVWFGPSDELQLRSSAPVRGVRVRFVALSAVAGLLPGAERAGGPRAERASGPVAGAAALTLAQPVLPAASGQPPIIARTAWAGQNHPPSAGPYYGDVKLAFVHHSDNPNGYSPGQVPALILSIYIFHRFTRGWFDIGYNFVIDASGRIWEARAGGIDLPVIGAQAGGYNAESTGVCMLGTFSAQLPTPPALDALQRLLAWKLSLHGVPVRGKVVVEVDPASAFYTPFRPGQLVPLPRIAGHRDGDTTDCPGNDLYGYLPTVRDRVQQLATTPAALTLQASRATVGPMTPVTLSGRFTMLTGAPIAGAPLLIQTIAGVGVETTIATVTTAADGSWSAVLTPTRSVIVRALHAVAPASASNLVAIGLAPAITLTLVSTSPLRVGGTLSPAKRRVILDVYRLTGQHRRLVATQKTIVRQGKFTQKVMLPRRARGRYEIVASTIADNSTAAGRSPALPVTV